MLDVEMPMFVCGAKEIIQSKNAMTQKTARHPAPNIKRVNFQSSVSSSLKVSVLQEELKHCPDQSFVNFLIKSLTEGFHTGINPLPTIPLECKNLLSARQDPDTITQ